MRSHKLPIIPAATRYSAGCCAEQEPSGSLCLQNHGGDQVQNQSFHLGCDFKHAAAGNCAALNAQHVPSSTAAGHFFYTRTRSGVLDLWWLCGEKSGVTIELIYIPSAQPTRQCISPNYYHSEIYHPSGSTGYHPVDNMGISRTRFDS